MIILFGTFRKIESGVFRKMLQGSSILNYVEDTAAPKMVPEWLEAAIKLGALCVGVIYVIGFVVVNTYYSQFGIADFSFFKARILAAGVLIFAMAAVPVVVASRAYGFFGLKQSGIEVTAPSGSEWIARWTVNAFLYSSACGIAYVFGTLMPPNSLAFSNRWWAILMVCCDIVPALLYSLAGKRLPKAVLTLAWVGVIGATVASYMGNAVFCVLVVWLSGISWITVYLGNAARRKASLLKDIRWETQLIMMILLPTSFASQIYGHIRVHFGGGLPARVVVQLNSSASKSFGSERFDGWLLDADDHGYYLLKSPQDHSAKYLSRDAVQVIDFLAEGEGHNETPKAK